MTGSNAVERNKVPRFGGVPVHKRLQDAAAALERAVMIRLVERLPVYGTLPHGAPRR